MKPTLMVRNLALFLACGVAIADGYQMHSSGETVSEPDLEAIAYASGIQFKRYDYDVPIDHCIDFFLETQLEEEPAKTSRSGHVCDRAGPHRLLILWERSNGELRFSKFLRHLEERTGYNSTTGGPTEIPEHAGFSGRALPSPVLEIGSSVALVDIDYWISEPDGKGGHHYSYHKRIRLLGELRSNSEKAVGSGGQ